MESVTLSFIGEISPGRGVLRAAHLSEGSSPELLLTSQVRKSWDTLHSTEARCFSPSLLAREQAKKLVTNQQWLLAPSMSNRHCALCHFALCLVCGPSQVSLDKISALNVSAACTKFLKGLKNQFFALEKFSLVSHYLSLALSTAQRCGELRRAVGSGYPQDQTKPALLHMYVTLLLCVRVRYNLDLCSYGKQRLHTPVTAGLS